MLNKRQYLGKWELGSLVFNSCIYKIFTSYPRVFAQISGSAGWITALFTGLIFLAVLFFLLTLYKPYENQGFPSLIAERKGKRLGSVIYKFFLLYWIFSALYALNEFSSVLTSVAYTRSPKLYISFFFLLGSVVTVLLGSRAVYRLHSLYVLSVGIITVIIAIFGLRYANPYYLTPIFGKGFKNVFLTGLSTLFLYSDIIFIFLLSPVCRPEINFSKTVLTGASLGVFVNVLLILICSMSQSADTQSIVSIPIYPLTKSAYFGRFWSRMDIAYLSALIVSGILYLSLAIHLITVCLRGRSAHKSNKAPKVATLVIVMCLILTGCFDSREVEQSAYLIALGIDKGENASYKYTFQFSNPLETGSSDNGKDESAEPMKAEDEPKNKGVNNVVIQAENFYSAMNILKSGMSKEPELSHLKAIIFSKELAKDGLLEHSSLLFREREIRPGVNLCLAESADDFLLNVKPTLELSTARYYELLFRNQNTPYAPVTELWDFVSQSSGTTEDSVLPIANENNLSGMGIFHKGIMVAEADSEKAMIYKLLSGNAHSISVKTDSSQFILTNRKKAKINLNRSTFPITAEISAKIDAELIYGTEDDVLNLETYLNTLATDFLTECSSFSADVLGIGNVMKTKYLTDADFSPHNSGEFAKVLNYSTSILPIIGRKTFYLQNF